LILSQKAAPITEVVDTIKISIS